MTVIEVIQRSAEFLAKKGIDSPRLQVELLLAHVLSMPRMKLYLNFDRVLKEEELNTLREAVKRRSNREPLQHIVGATSFCGLDIAVNRNVLVPRPETELLAEHAWKFLGTLSSGPERISVLDFGTGSGCLAIALATKCPAAEVHAVDISAEALVVARKNAEIHGVTGRIVFHHGDGFSGVPLGLKLDLIVTNPPYIPTGEIETLEPEVREFDPRAALDGGLDGLDYYRHLSASASAFLKPNGRIMMELGDEQAPAIKQIFSSQGWRNIEVAQDDTRRDRFLFAIAGPQMV